MEPTRKILSPKRGEDGLFVQPHDNSAKRQVIENHNRDRFASHFNYADPETGNTRTYDKKGNYNCGACNQANGSKCLLVDIPKIDRVAGSCEDWEIICAGDPEMKLNEKKPDLANYGVARNGVGFGCHRCPFASKAFEPDSVGRTLYCGKGDMRVFKFACCTLNGAALVSDGDSDEDDKHGTKGALGAMNEALEKY